MATRGSPALYLGLLAIIAAYAVFQDGGVPFADWLPCLLALGLLSAVYWLRGSNASLIPPMEPGLGWAVLLFAPYVAGQLLPMPLFLLQILSPARAGLAAALRPVMQPASFASLAITPSVTCIHLLRIAAYTLVFLLVRGIAVRSFKRPWVPVLPILIVAALEAALGLAQCAAGAEHANGTYINKNHYAGLLEMALPLAVMYGIALLFGRGSGKFSSAFPALQASVVLSLAAVIFVAILYSLSRMGFVAALASLFVMAGLALGRRLPRRWTYSAVACLAILFLISFFLLPPNALIAQFAKVTASENFTGEARFGIWRDTLRLNRDYPLFGCGLGAFDVAFLKYQTAVVDLDFAFAHNDYLELLAELGAVGFLIPAVLILMVLRRAVRATARGLEPHTRYLGLASVGAFTAILIHSLGDFNLYIPANALVLAWIAGIAAALPPSSGQADKKPPSPRPVWLHNLAVALSVLLVVYASAWILFESQFRKERRAERLFCSVGICDTETALAVRQLEGGGSKGPSPADAREFLRRDPASPYRWADLGESLLDTGTVPMARYCFSRALELGPNDPPILWRAASFSSSLGDNQKAVEQTSHLLQVSSLYDSTVFSWYADRAIPLDEILRHGIPPDPRAFRAWLRYLLAQNNYAGAVRTWDSVLSHGFADDDLARDFVNFLMQRKDYELAANSWAAYLGPRCRGYRRSNWLYNGDFALDSSGSPFDWQITHQPGVDVAPDRAVVYSGVSSLRIRFPGDANPAWAGVAQTAVVKPGWHLFEAFVRTEDLTTDQGISFRIFDPENVARLNVRTGQLLGTNGWTRISQTFLVPPEARLVEVQIIRPRSFKNDSQIHGTAWIGLVRLAPDSERAR